MAKKHPASPKGSLKIPAGGLKGSTPNPPRNVVRGK